MIHAIKTYGTILTCAKNLMISNTDAEMIQSLFPDAIEIGIPVICGFHFMGRVCPNVCFWCRTEVNNTFLSKGTAFDFETL